VNNETAQAQIAENFRFYGDMRFKQLTLFMAAMTAVVAGVMQFPCNRWWLALGGLFVTAVMWVVEVRATLNAIVAHNAIPEAFPQQQDKFWPWLNSSWSVLLLHIACYGLWLWCVRAWCSSRVLFYVGALAGLMLFVFSVVNYWQQRKFWLGPR
jgi:hypothetical protein